MWRRQFFELILARGRILILERIDARHDERIVQLGRNPAGTRRG